MLRFYDHTVELKLDKVLSVYTVVSRILHRTDKRGGEEKVDEAPQLKFLAMPLIWVTM